MSALVVWTRSPMVLYIFGHVLLFFCHFEHFFCDFATFWLSRAQALFLLVLLLNLPVTFSSLTVLFVSWLFLSSLLCFVVLWLTCWFSLWQLHISSWWFYACLSCFGNISKFIFIFFNLCYFSLWSPLGKRKSQFSQEWTACIPPRGWIDLLVAFLCLFHCFLIILHLSGPFIFPSRSPASLCEPLLSFFVQLNISLCCFHACGPFAGVTETGSRSGCAVSVLHFQ